MRSDAGLTYSTMPFAVVTAIASAEFSTSRRNRRSASAMPVTSVTAASTSSRPPYQNGVIWMSTAMTSPFFFQCLPAREYVADGFGAA